MSASANRYAAIDAHERAIRSGGESSAEIYRMVARTLEAMPSVGGGAELLDIGCGAGRLWHFVAGRCSRYTGVDLVRYEGFPPDAAMIEANLDKLPLPIPAESADVVAAVETIEHLENPRAFMRELVRLARPGGVVIVTTPNQLSLLSKLTLVIKNRFNAFQDVQYPAHLTALLEIDLIRIAREARLTDLRVAFSRSGRLIFTPWHYPAILPRLWPRAMSDNICIAGRKPAAETLIRTLPERR